MSHSRQEPKQEVKKSTLTIAQSLFMGSVAGMVEVLFNHPLWSIKTRKQRGDYFTLNPSILYRGMLPNAASMVPITAIQVALNCYLQTSFFKNVQELSNLQRFTAAFFAGMGSSLVSCPTEMVMTYQGKTGGSFYHCMKALTTDGGVRRVYTGLPATAMRDGLFAAFFLAVKPILKPHFQPYFSKDYYASVSAGIAAGLGATLASQAFDTIKTVQQASEPAQKMSFKKACKSLHTSHGFFKGGLSRGARVILAVTEMGLVNEALEKKLCK
jgi:hypothetical protein